MKSLFTAVSAALVVLGLSSAVAAQPLPDYRPAERITGTIRFTGNEHMAPVLARWQAAFRKHHPDVRFEQNLQGTGSALYGIEMRTADLALMSRPMNPFERYGTYERSWTFPVEVEVATGSAFAPGKSPAHAVFVHRSNPLKQLTLQQLDGIYGAQRGGGWRGLSWDEKSARPASADLRSWGQLQLGGEWSAKAIHPYGPPHQGAGTVTFFQTRVLQGGAMWNPELREYVDTGKMLSDLARDPQGIAYGPLGLAHPDLKPVAVADSPAGPFVLPSAKTVADRSYPLSRAVYMVYTVDNVRNEVADPRVAPKVREFLRFVLSRQGQREVEKAGGYLPLAGANVAAQRERLESRAPLPEREVLLQR